MNNLPQIQYNITVESTWPTFKLGLCILNNTDYNWKVDLCETVTCLGLRSTVWVLLWNIGTKVH